MASLLLGNPMDSFNQGQAVGRQNRFNSLAGQAISADPSQRAGLIGQAAQADPMKAVALQGAMSQQDDSDEDRRNKTLVNMSRLLVSAPDQFKDQVYQQIKPSLQKLGLQTVPDTYTPEVGQVAKNIADAWTPLSSQPTGLREIQGQIAGAGLSGDDAKKAYRVSLGLDPRAVTGAAKTGMITGADGRERPYMFDPATQQYSVFDGATWHPLGQQEAAQLGAQPGQAIGASASQSPNLDSLMAQATAMANQGGPGANKAAAEQWLQQQVASQGMQPQATATDPGLGVGRAPEDTAAATEAAKQGVQTAYLPQQEAIKTNAAIQQAGGTVTAKAMAERAVDRPQAAMALQDASANLDRMASTAQAVMNHPGLNGITSWKGKVPDRPGSEAADARAELTALKSQVGFSVLQAMRNASKTGGALGSVSDQEGVRLESNLAALQESQSTEQFKANLQKIIDYAQGAKGRLSGAYQSTYSNGQQPGAAPSSPQQSAPVNVDDLLSKYGVH